jgi:hypothetical protein
MYAGGKPEYDMRKTYSNSNRLTSAEKRMHLRGQGLAKGDFIAPRGMGARLWVRAALYPHI